MVDYCKQCGQWPTHKEGCANQDNALPRLRQQNSALRQQLEELTQERDEWMQQAEHRRVIIRDRKAQVQKYKDKLTRCSAMFDEVEDALADSCRREGKYKKASEKIWEDFINAVEKESGIKQENLLGSVEKHRVIFMQSYTQQALPGESKEETIIDIRAGVQIGTPTGSDKGTGTIRYPKAHCKEDMELCPECGDRAVVLGADYNTCTSCGDEDVVFVPSKDMVLVSKIDIEKLEQARLNLYALFPEADTNLIVNLSYVSDPMWKITKGRLPVKIKAAEKCEHGRGLTDYCEPCGRINNYEN